MDLALAISDDEFEEKVVNSFSTIYLFFFGSGLFLIFLYAIRKYFI